MDGKLKMIILIILFLSCKNKNDLNNNHIQVVLDNGGREFIIQNINTLIDSIERFDMSKIPRSGKFKDIKIEKIRIGLIDSILIETNQINEQEFLRFNLHKKDLIHFKSEYKINIVKLNNYDADVLFVSFSNFKFNKNKVVIDVKKVIGISMIKERYYFEKQNDIWVLKKKELLGMG